MTTYLITMIVIHMLVAVLAIAPEPKDPVRHSKSARTIRFFLYSGFVWWGFTLLVEHLQKGAA